MNQEIAQNFWRRVEAEHAPMTWAILATAYSEPHRAYHAFNHIIDLLEKLDRFRHLATRPDLIAIAIFWHDAVYATRDTHGRSRSDHENVDDSVALFRRYARFGQDDVDAVCDMIHATAHHARARAAREFYPGYSQDLDLFLDLDLSPLAAPWPVFSQNLADIRHEFAWVPEAVFYRGRLQMLETLARNGARLFRRDETAKEWEEAALSNIARLSTDLRGQLARLASPA